MTNTRGNCHEQIINKVSSSNRYWSSIIRDIRTLGFSIAPNTFIKPKISYINCFGALFGPVAGLLIGLIGHTVTDTIVGVFGGAVISSGIIGFSMGLIQKELALV